MVAGFADRAEYRAWLAEKRPYADADPALAGWRLLLRRHRDARRWSQERCAAECAMDHSLVSRLESGQRAPTRETIGKLAAGLALSREDAERLHLEAGYLPPTVAAADLARALALVRAASPGEVEAARALIDAARRA